MDEKADFRMGVLVRRRGFPYFAGGDSPILAAVSPTFGCAVVFYVRN